MPVDRSSLEALKNIIEETDLLISTTSPLPENRTPRCRELLRTASYGQNVVELYNLGKMGRILVTPPASVSKLKISESDTRQNQPLELI